MTILLQGSTDARKLGTRSIKRVYQEIKNKNKPDSNITKNYCKLALNKDFLESRTVTQKMQI